MLNTIVRVLVGAVVAALALAGCAGGLSGQGSDSSDLVSAGTEILSTAQQQAAELADEAVGQAVTDACARLTDTGDDASSCETTVNDALTAYRAAEDRGFQARLAVAECALTVDTVDGLLACVEKRLAA